MKRICFTIIALSLLGNLCLGGSSSAKKETAVLTARLLISELREKVETREIPEGLLYSTMKGNAKGKYTNPSDASRLLKDVAKDDMKQWYGAEVQGILEELDKKRPEGSESYFKGMEDLKRFPEGEANRNILNNYNSVFGKARKGVCKDQMMTYDVYPSEQEFDQAKSEGKISELRSTILDKLVRKQREPVFSENKILLGRDFIGPVFEDAEKQWKGQINTVDRSRGGSAVTSGGIESRIRGEIDEYRKGLETERKDKKIANKVYKIFPSVGKRIPNRADTLVKDKFSTSLSRMEFPVSKDEIKSYINSGIAKHPQRKQSRSLCLRKFWDAIKTKAIEEYAKNVPESQRKKFRKFLDKLVTETEKCNSAFVRVLERSVDQNLGNAREEIRDEQFREFFAPLEKDFWRPGPEEIDKQYKKPGVSVPEPLKVPNISSKLFDETELLEETLNKVRQTEESIIRKGVAALKKQMGIVEGLKPEVKKELEGMAELPIVEGLTRTYTRKVESAWSSAGEAAKEYEDLFERTRNDIREKAKDMLPLETKRRKQVAIAEANEAKAAAAVAAARGAGQPGAGKGLDEKGGSKAPAKGPGGKGIGGGKGKGEGPGKKPEKGQRPVDAFIDLDYDGKMITASVLFPKKGPAVFNFVLGVGSQIDLLIKQASMEKAQKLFEAWLASIETKEKQDTSVYVVCRVFDGRVQYGVVFEFRECLRKAADAVKEKRLKINWYDGLFEREEKGRREIEPRIRRRFQPLKDNKILV